MAAQKSKNQINLLPSNDVASTTTGRILHWLLSTFRYLVITTEVIVIIAFLSRFYFDSRAADLNDEISQKQEFIEAYKEFETDFRLTQKRLAAFSQITTDSNLATPLVRKIAESLPEKVALETLSLSTQKSITLEGNANNEVDISQFIANLNTQSEFESVNLTKVESSDQSPRVQFSISIALQPM